MSDGDRRTLTKGGRRVRIGFNLAESETAHRIEKACAAPIGDIEVPHVEGSAGEVGRLELLARTAIE